MGIHYYLNPGGVVMAFDFKKEYKEFYMPKNKPEIGKLYCGKRQR